MFVICGIIIICCEGLSFPKYIFHQFGCEHVCNSCPPKWGLEPTPDPFKFQVPVSGASPTLEMIYYPSNPCASHGPTHSRRYLFLYPPRVVGSWQLGSSGFALSLTPARLVLTLSFPNVLPEPNRSLQRSGAIVFCSTRAETHVIYPFTYIYENLRKQSLRSVFFTLGNKARVSLTKVVIYVVRRTSNLIHTPFR